MSHVDFKKSDVEHAECNILGLVQRRRKQLSSLNVYNHSKDYNNTKKPVRLTQAVTKIVFETATRCLGKYLNSHFYKGTIMWNGLSDELQKSYNVIAFIGYLKKISRNMVTSMREDVELLEIILFYYIIL